MEPKYWIILIIIIIVLLFLTLGFYFYNEYLKKNIVEVKQKYIITSNNTPRTINIWVEVQPTEDNSSKCLMYTFPTTYIESDNTYYVGKPSYNKNQLEILDGIDPITSKNVKCLYPNQILAKALTYSCPTGKCIDENGNEVPEGAEMIMYKPCDPNDNFCSRSNRRSDCDDPIQYPPKELKECNGSLGVVNVGNLAYQYNGTYNCLSSNDKAQTCQLSESNQQGVLSRASLSKNTIVEDTSGYFVKFSTLQDPEMILQVKKNNNSSIPYYYNTCSTLDTLLLTTEKERLAYAKKVNQTSNRYSISTSPNSSNLVLIDTNPQLNTNIPARSGYLWMLLPSFKTNYGSLKNNQFSERLIYIGDRNDTFIQRIIDLLGSKNYINLLTFLDNENVLTLSLYNTYVDRKTPELNAYFILSSYEKSIIRCIDQYTEEGKEFSQYNNQPFSYQTLIYNLYNLQQTEDVYGN